MKSLLLARGQERERSTLYRIRDVKLYRNTRRKRNVSPINDLEFPPSNLETIDFALYDYIKNEFGLNTMTNEGRKEVPVIWASAERSFQVKNSQEYRDNEGLIILPAITIERTGFEKNLSRKGRYYGGMFPIQTQIEKGGSLVVSRRIKQDKTSNFANADADRRYNDRVAPNFVRTPTEKVVYETVSVPPVVYVSVNYKIKIRTEYQQQMNDLVQPFVTRTGIINSFMVTRDGHAYETFINSDFQSNNNIASMEGEERRYETDVSLEVLGYLIGDGENQKTPKYSVRESAVQIRIQRERRVFDDPLVTGGPGGDSKRNFGVDGKYRE